MNFDEYFSHKEKINDLILSFLDDNEDNDENFRKLSVFQKEHITEDRDELQLYLRLILRITSEHHRQPNFLQKIKQIVFSLEDSIKFFFTNFEIFNIFSNCKIILLFLFEKKILMMDESICRILQYKRELNSTVFCHFFYPELKPYLDEERQSIIKEELFEMSPRIFEFFEEARQKGENHSYLCQLIRNDDINEFIIYINQKNISVTSVIEPSFFETNLYLINHETSLIEYAAFFGSIQIFQYLLLNNAKLNQLIWKYAIHGKNPEIIHIIEGYDIKIMNKNFYEKCYRVSIKCHHNDIANYIKDNLLEPNYSINKIITFHLRYSNYFDLPKNFYNNLNFFSCLCEGNYLNLVKELFLNKEKDKIEYNLSEVFNLAAKQNSIDVLQFLSNQDNIEINHDFFIYRKLTKIEINSQLIFKPENLIFKGCCSLTQITLPSTLKAIENKSFFGCYSLLKLIIPSSVTSIGSFAFYDCLSLLEIEFPPNVIEIKKGTFYNCKSLKRITLPSNLAKISDYSFCNCSSLVEVTLNKESSFDDDSLMKQKIESISKSVGIYAFKDCTSLKKVIIPPLITMIREYAFNNCQSLTNVLIPSETTFIGYEAFSKCSNIKIDQLSLPKSLINIGSNIFATDKTLKEKVDTILCVNINDDYDAYAIGSVYENEFGITNAFVISDIYTKYSECFGFIGFINQVDFQSIIMFEKTKTDKCNWNSYPSIRYNAWIDERDDFVYEYDSDDNEKDDDV